LAVLIIYLFEKESNYYSRGLLPFRSRFLSGIPDSVREYCRGHDRGVSGRYHETQPVHPDGATRPLSP
jgi:hypothetical protein